MIFHPGDIEKVKNRVGLFKVPNGVSKLQGLIGSRYCGFTANRWKNWILLHSPVVLNLKCHGMLVTLCSCMQVNL